MMLSERQYPAVRALICTGDIGHVANMPRIHADGVTGDVRCEECGEPMHLVDIITVDRQPTWSQLQYNRGGRLYTDAKLHPLALLAGIR
jgi:hypothetical protein